MNFDIRTIPDYEKVFDDLWKMQKTEMELKYVNRVGYPRFRYYNTPGARASYDTPINDMDHNMNGLFFLFNLKEMVGDYLHFVDWGKEFSTFIIHELEETIGGDTPDNGTCSAVEKERRETAFMKDFLEPLPNVGRKQQILSNFSLFQMKLSLSYGVDKLAFLIGQGFLISKGIRGDMLNPFEMGELSFQDIELVEKCDSWEPFDSIFYRFIEQTKYVHYQSVLIAFVEAIYRAEFSDAPYYGLPPKEIRRTYIL